MYLALYRKYRPRTFDDVISQEHITTTLRNQVAGGTAAHAYLFTGSRGTGKTSCAKIMAMAVNCLSPKNGNPCLECERCREILNGETTDIVEMDAASNNGVDDVRQLRDEVAYTPVSCKFRVYIIDEVHMLSPAAFNALLKTLEEPPPHVKFILATTELHKVPATISSRCQRFEFRRVDAADSAKRLSEVAAKENVRLDDDAAELISRLSDGGMRDALSLLDRCVSASEHVTAQLVRDCAGVADNKHLFKFSEMIAKNDVPGCIRLLGELHKGSKDLAIVIDELTTHFRDIMLYKTAPDDTDLLSVLPDDHPNVAAAAQLYDLENILRCLTLLQQCADSIGKTKQRKTLAEMCLVKMCAGVQAADAYAPRAAIKPVQPQPIIKLKDPPPDDFVPKPYEEMSESERITAKLTAELIESTTKKLRAAEAAQAAEAEAQAPEAPEPPPAEDAPSDSFLSNDYPIDSEPREAEAAAPAAPEPPARETEPAEKAPEKPAAEVLASLTDEQWRETIAQMNNFVHASMLTGSEATLSGGVLEVFSDDPLLLENVRDDEHKDVERELSDILGFPIRLKITSGKKAAEPPPKSSDKLGRVLNKAKQRGIEVQNKNDQ